MQKNKVKLLRKSKPTTAAATASEIKYVQRALKLLMKRSAEKGARLRKLARHEDAHYQHASFALSAFTRLVQKSALAVILVTLAIATAHADDRNKRRERHEMHDYIIERQQAGAVQGPPTSRLYIGNRKIDIYSNGLMFEGNNVIGVRGR
jgi:hypothetical protein